MKCYPALDILTHDADILYAALDDLAPTAIEERDNGLRAFFTGEHARDLARTALAPQFKVASVDVPDEDWARRSQESLQPVTVGRITVVPNGTYDVTPSRITVVIQPSMGFGTGHHATTRLCLAALQAFDLSGKTFLDIGTGSGVLAIAAARLGASGVTGIDLDPDAIQSARENLALNPDAHHVAFERENLADARLPRADIVAANLTGALLSRSASTILEATTPGGLVILSGLMRHERDDVRRAFEPASIEWEREEDEWVGLAVKRA